MSLLIVEQSGRRTPVTLNGSLAIGRGSACRLRIDHPLVSRDHAIIEHSPLGYTIRDIGSRNGTKLNNRRVTAPALLQEGDRILIGPTTLWFHVTEQDEHDQRPVTDAEEGIVFQCDCTARLWVPMALAGAAVRCRQCNCEVTCPSLFTPTEQRDTTAVADCSICLSKVTSEDEQHACESCGAVYHVECWTDNCGCAAYGCKQVNVFANDHHATGSAAPGAEEVELEDLSEPSNKVPWDAVLVGAATVGTILGLFCFGGTALLVVMFATGYLLRRRTKWVWGALLLALAGFVAGVVVSGLWWLNISPKQWIDWLLR
jgi:pSer/pThr/pTyr-binding forkhead associated (FHA) protein